ncbi:uncharacterized protein LOC103711127 [Phoenix dactylifera]|uniref:Uncharacterized protein LOC103711127 n=1 Tax=Phoenix dactylifera TaxID=42345 RepID=A0A8B7CB43_PHODC|nr:uncharacterized protein LOC103711127 [Phoenix dactylifera]
MGQKPLMLKEYLELDSDLESCSGFGCAPRRGDAATMRCLLEAELRGCGGGRLVRARSMGALTRLSAVIHAVRLLPFGGFSAGCRSSHEGFLSRSFSKRLRGSFWKKRGKEEEHKARVRVIDIVQLKSFEEEGEERKSFGFPSPVVSSCSSWSESYSSGSDFLRSSIGSSECLGEIDAADDGDGDGEKGSPPRRSPSLKRSPKGRNAVGGDSVTVETSTGHREPEGKTMECLGCQPEEEKEQLSPVSVMDFPSEDEEEESSPSPSFQQSHAKVERTKLQRMQKIRRFESLAELEAVDLEDRFSSLEDPTESTDHVESDNAEEAHRDTVETRAWDLLEDLEARSHVGPALGCIEKLLLDFFIERLSSSDSVDHSCLLRTRITSGVREPAGLLKAARDWINGESSREVEELPLVAVLKEMDRNGRWRCLDKEDEELAVDLVDAMLGSLVGELALDLVS